MERDQDSKRDSVSNDGVPRFNIPMILMQSVLVPEYSNEPDTVNPALPCLTHRVCSRSPSSANRKDSNTCQLPFQDREALTGYSSSIGRRSSFKTPAAPTAKIQKERTDEAKKRLDRKLHAEHRVFMENLKLERESNHRRRTIAAIVIQRNIRGLSVRIKMNPEKYALLRASLEKHYTMEELSDLIGDAIRRSGIIV
mmetsp:Transcript_3596/g.7931  ORF Transcript_3596/g.7931 Transcript_3596/m.7931 type:complete len:197 (+) Transcript_3596:539-1129(+)|eukprot:CAMPEP_0183737194 /NCGR_PEP_ID=MMETSP0737-20130205/51288_1 /TAXON_ID=385413 /ORGANISM="Thalassiosira miniscula, Strain CCMP1093" /LENGTH=196 /DNA_ID=CAMNT_0025971421 /DNA_START=408 /DNA_END=998 /DNA_ORIENTATION=-